MATMSQGGIETGPVRPALPVRERGGEPVRAGPQLAALPTESAEAARATRLQRWTLLGGLVVVAWLALSLFASILLPFVAASGIAYFLDPVARRLTRLGVPRGAAALLLIIGLIAVGLVAVLLLYPLVVQQVGLLAARLPDYVLAMRNFAQQVVNELQQKLGPDYVNSKLRDLVGSEAGAILGFLAQALTRLITGGFALFNVLSLAVVTPVVAFYLLRDWPKVVARVDSWLPRRYAAVLRAQAHEVDRILSAWLRGQLICCLFLAIFYATGLSLIGLDLGLIVGLSAGLLSFIPYVGTITGAVVSMALALAQFPLWSGLMRVGAVFLIGNLLEGYVIYPRFLGDRVELPAVWVIFALFAGGAAFGFLGVLLAVPVTAVIGVLARFWLRRYLRSPLYLDPPSETEP
jgi:predicted PurR-regulated permease PerM